MNTNDLIHRDLSWISFNERVLQEAENEDLPLYERLKFLSIFSSNLDEFYRVRVSELRQFKNLQKDIRKKLDEKPKKVIKEIQQQVGKLQARFGHTYEEDIVPKLRARGISLIQADDFSKEERAFAKDYFRNEIAQHIEVHYLDDDTDFSFLSDKSLFLVLDLEQEVIINIPSDKAPRFMTFPADYGSYAITFLDDVIRVNLAEINPEFKGAPAYCVKITRDAELYFDEYAGELVELIKENLAQRDDGIPTRLLYDMDIPQPLLKRLRKRLGLNKTDLMLGGRYHNFSDFFSFPDPTNNPDFKYKPLPPSPHTILEAQDSLIDYIQDNNVLLSFPYQKYDYIPQIILEAAKRDEVLSINITLYRVSKTSAIANALLQCLENGKKVTVFIEAKARFDEENNIYWGEKLKENGANVLYSMPKIKVHSKIFLIEATDYDIAYVGTGNFNEKSAKLYTDFALLTSDKAVASDLRQVFSFLNDPEATQCQPQKIWMSPFTTRKSIYEKIDREIALVQQGKKGSLFFKMNSLEDEGVIQKLYEASQKGVEVKLIVRGIFRLKPGLEGLSDNIKAVSIVGRFLEHARVYCFGNDGEEEIYIASADCMTRNLDKRVEVGIPIEDEQSQTILKQCMNLQWNDNTKARILDADQYNFYQKNNSGIAINAQEDFYGYLRG